MVGKKQNSSFKWYVETYNPFTGAIVESKGPYDTLVQMSNECNMSYELLYNCCKYKKNHTFMKVWCERKQLAPKTILIGDVAIELVNNV